MIFGFDRTEVQPAETQQSNQTSCRTVDQILTMMHVFVLLLFSCCSGISLTDIFKKYNLENRLETKC